MILVQPELPETMIIAIGIVVIVIVCMGNRFRFWTGHGIGVPPLGHLLVLVLALLDLVPATDVVDILGLAAHPGPAAELLEQLVLGLAQSPLQAAQPRLIWLRLVLRPRPRVGGHVPLLLGLGWWRRWCCGINIRGSGNRAGEGKFLGQIGEQSGSGQRIGQWEGRSHRNRRLRAEFVQRLGEAARVQVALGHSRFLKVEAAKLYFNLFN